MDYGFPELMPTRLFGLEPNETIKTGRYGVKPNSDYVFCLRHSGDYGWLIRAGVDPKKLIIHFYSYDEGTIEPLWADFPRIEKVLNNIGCTTVVAPDFSQCITYPYAVQIYNCFKERVVSRELQSAGFDLIPQFRWNDENSFEWCFQGLPEYIPTAIVDMNHINTPILIEYEKRGLQEVYKRFKIDTLIFLGNSKKLFKELAWTLSEFPGRIIRLDTRIALTKKVDKAMGNKQFEENRQTKTNQKVKTIRFSKSKI